MSMWHMACPSILEVYTANKITIKNITSTFKLIIFNRNDCHLEIVTLTIWVLCKNIWLDLPH